MDYTTPPLGVAKVRKKIFSKKNLFPNFRPLPPSGGVGLHMYMYRRIEYGCAAVQMGLPKFWRLKAKKKKE